jgi:hypothetical protein
MPVPQSRRGVTSSPATGVVGHAVEGLGGTVEKIGNDLIDRQDKLQYTVAATAALQANNDQLAAAEHDPDPATSVARYRETMKGAYTQAASQIGNSDDRAVFLAQSNADIARGEYTVGQIAAPKIEHAVNATAVNTRAANLQQFVGGKTKADRDKAVKLAGATFDGQVQLGYMDAPTAAAGKREWASTASVASVHRQTVLGNIAEARAQWAELSPLMSPEAATATLQDIDVEERRQAAQARMLVAEQRAGDAHARALKREDLSAVKVALDKGAGTPADWEKLATSYEAIGDTSSAVDAHSRGVEMGAAIKYRGVGLPQLDQRITELQGKQSLSVDEASELRGIRTLREQTQQRLNQPGGALTQFQFATGKSIEPLNPDDPHTFARRASLAISAARTYGRQMVEPLTAADAQPLKDLVSSGDPTKRLNALMVITKFGNPLAIEGAARQVAADGDGGFRIAATLLTLPGDAGAQAARDILRGPEAAKTNGQVFLPSEAKRIFQDYAAPALVNMPANYGGDVYTAAWNLYVSRMTQHGKAAWDEN